MKNLLLCISFLILTTSCVSVKRYNEQITNLHPVEDLQKDVDKLYNQLKKNHPRLYQYTPKETLDFKFDSLKKSIKTPMDSRVFYKKLAPVVANVRQGHIAVSSASKQFNKQERKELKKKKFEFYDLDFEYLEGKLWVKANRGKDSLLVGSEVVSINDEPAKKLVETYKTRFSSDGYNTTLYNRYVSKGFAYYYYKDKGYLDSLKVTFKNKDSLFTKILKRILKKEKTHEKLADSLKNIKPPKPSKEEKKEKRRLAKKRKKDNRKYGYISKRKQYTRNFNFIGKDSSVAYMKIRSFTNGNYKKFYKESFKKMDSLKTKYFILDLRDNGGGRIAEIEKLYSYLTDREYQFILESEVTNRTPFFKYLMSNTTPNGLKVATGLLSPIILVHNLLHTKKKDGKLYYKFGESKIKKPNPLNYKGKMYVLINGNSFSASSLLSTHLKATKRAVFVGEETGGAYNGTVAGIYKLYRLPTSKLKVRMGLMQIEAPQKQTPDGYGVKPDVEILPTVKDFQSHSDPQLNWILKDIEKF
ncbi:peptidase S41 [Seonamhaeicola sp. S2-3]|uniref:S41 family peptidase n=1 Tax=Seonamhaeicola sp. S2-3 TaxID=1936081 RepID=UPI000972BEEE|nr:S41 family peptidase [Seonamhaeicola sp. S2-3]APY11940.1 peptidase S41 [Seonamhaeicola sp. S2-3]